MWDFYADDDAFEKMAKAKVTHDGKLLARVLYGKEVKRKQEDVRRKSSRKTERKIQFCRDFGTLTIDPSLSQPVEGEETVLMSRMPDYSFEAVKEPAAFSTTDGPPSRDPSTTVNRAGSRRSTVQGPVKTDVVVFDRRHTSEYDAEREELKDNVLSWRERYNARQNMNSTENK
jgi:hypothetical protein